VYETEQARVKLRANMRAEISTKLPVPVRRTVLRKAATRESQAAQLTATKERPMPGMGRSTSLAMPPNGGLCYFGVVLDGLPLEGEPEDGDPAEGEPMEGEPVDGLPEVPEESPFIVGLLLVVPVLVDPLVPCPVVLPLVPYAPVESVPVPMLPGWLCVPCVLWVPLALEPVPVLPAVPVPAPLPDVWARAKVPSESVATNRSFRIVFDLSLLQVWVVAARCGRF